MVLLVTITLTWSCSSSKTSNENHTPPAKPAVTVNTSTQGVQEGLDLKALGALVQKSQNAQQIERELNKQGSINNLDFDEDGKVDYISVQEFEGGFSFYIDTKDEEIPVADVQIEKKSGEKATVHLSGSEYVYGANPPHYSSHISMTDLMIAAWLFSPRPMYVSPFGFGHYPGYYQPYAPVPHSTYTSRAQRQRNNKNNFIKSTPKSDLGKKSPNRARSNAINKNPAKRNKLTNSKYAQSNNSRKFAKRDANKSVGKGGFGNKNKTSKTPLKAKPSPKSKPSRNTKPSRSSRPSRRSFSRPSRSRRSDVEYKTGIRPITNATAIVSSMSGYTYQWDREKWPETVFSNNNDSQYGLLAQEVQRVVPELVQLNTEGALEVDYELMVPILLQAIKEQNKRIEMLEQQLKNNE